jgi:hypothetical protein
MLSAAIAGLGGCLYAQEIGAVTADRFSLFESMTLLMLLVVAGTGYVSGGLTAGLLYGAAFVVLSNVLTEVGTKVSGLHGLTAWLVSFTVVLPALIGIALGRNPSGFLGDAFGPWGELIRRNKPVLFAGIAVELLVWALAFEHTINNWTFAIATALLVIALPRLGGALANRPALHAASDETPLELVGIDRPFTADDVDALDRAIGFAGSRS